MTVHILTDSTPYMQPSDVEALGFHIVPLGVNLGGREYKEQLEITTEELFEHLKDKSVSWPTTAAATPGAIKQAFDELTAAPEDEVVGVFMSRGTSVTVEVAQTVAAEHPARDRIHVVDSLVISGALALTLRTVCPLAKAGVPAAKVAEVARRMGEQMRVMFTVDTLEYLHRGGRMKGSQALVGSLLGIKPVLWLNKGVIELWGRARGKKKALNMMLEESVKAMPAGEPVLALLFDADAQADSDAMRQRLAERLDCVQIYTERIGPVVAAHVGPGCLAMAVCPASAARPQD